jgi:hypothetical protein
MSDLSPELQQTIHELAAAIAVPAWGHKNCGRCQHKRYDHANTKGIFGGTKTMLGHCNMTDCDCNKYDYLHETETAEDRR